jgi:hypothetical protein
VSWVDTADVQDLDMNDLVQLICCKIKFMGLNATTTYVQICYEGVDFDLLVCHQMYIDCKGVHNQDAFNCEHPAVSRQSVA